MPHVVGLREVDLNGGAVLLPYRSPAAAKPDVMLVPLCLVKEQ
jgi:hypothetical protein